MKIKTIIQKLVMLILLIGFSLVLGSLLESLRYLTLTYYMKTSDEIRGSTELLMRLHSSAADLYPKHLTFLDLMLLPCFLLLCFDHKVFFKSTGSLKFTLHCLIVMMINLTMAGIISLIFVAPIYKLGIMPNYDIEESLASKTIAYIAFSVLLLAIILLFKELFFKRQR